MSKARGAAQINFWLGFAAAILTVVLLVASTWLASQKSLQIAFALSRANDILNGLAHVRSDTVQIELDTQTFRISADPAALKERDHAVATRESALKHIHELTLADPAQAKQWMQLRAVVDQRLAISKQAVRLRETQGLAAASAFIAMAPLRETRERLYRIVRDMEHHEEQQLSLLQAQQTRAGWAAAIAGTSAAAALIALLGATFLVMRRQLRETTASNSSLDAAQARLASILATVPDGIISLDEHGKISSFNPAAERIFTYGASEVIGRDALMLLAPPDTAEIYEVLNQAATSGSYPPLGQDLYGKRKSGEYFPLELSISGSKDNSGAQRIWVVRDITQRKRVEILKTEFVSTVSHELRTPLTAISGALGLIVGGALGRIPERIQHVLSIAHKNSLRLGRLIDDLLDIEKLNAGKMPLTLQTQSLLAIIHSAIESTQAYAEKYQVSLILAAHTPDVPVRVDPLRLQQVMANLLSNAAKFSPEQGRVDIEVVPSEQGVQVRVSDHGEGIPLAFQQHIFQKFSQADASDTRQKGGTGLGLAISKELIEQMGGSIGFHSQPGQGACFYFELPVDTGAQSLARPAHEPESSKETG